ncbi:MAG: FAD-dependent oxidoreductase, partial [Candidatus Tectomicrobia bacterium]|nr:FAD-dependent oxidoreductase [Candidatus Tectomicrobia bacterium]
MRKNKVTVLAGRGVIPAAGQVEVRGADGKPREGLTAKNILLATGSRAQSLPGVAIDGKKILSSTEAMLLDSIPESMIIVGGGAVGVEFAYLYNAYGTKVTLLEMLPTLLPNEDQEISEQLRRSFQKQGIQVLLGAKVEEVKTAGKGVQVSVQAGEAGEPQNITGELLLMAVGRQPNSDGIGIEELKVELDHGFVKVDKTMRSSVPGLYAIGDVIGAPLLAHVASAEGIVAVETMAGQSPAGLNYANIPSCTYCQPQVASVGLTEEQAKKEGHEVRVGRFPFRASGKALALGEEEGMVKIVAAAKHGAILGVHIIGADATEQIAEAGLALTLEATLEEIAATVH